MVPAAPRHPRAIPVTRPDLSIIIVSWNVRDALRRCLAALPGAVGDYAYEVIVVDNASEDGTVEQLRSADFAPKVIANPDNRLYTAAANQGLALARGRHLMLLNPDTLPHPGSLARLIQYADITSRAGLLGPRLVDGSGRVDLRTGRDYPGLWSECCDWLGLAERFPDSRLLAGNLHAGYDRRGVGPAPVLSGACLLLCERLPPSLRRLDPSFPMYGEDLDLCRRVQARELQTILVGDAVVVHFGGMSARQANAASAVLAVDGANRYFSRWRGRRTARRHRLLMALIALVKIVTFTLMAVIRPAASARRRPYTAILKWSCGGAPSGLAINDR